MRRQGGQALVMVTLSLFAMCGLMGLAIDLGWSFYVHKMARAAADSAAMAAVNEALVSVSGNAGPYSCATTGLTCSGLIDCTASAPGNLGVGCGFAIQNGFSVSGNGGRQQLTIEANVPALACRYDSPPTCVPTAPGVGAFYWVHVVATENIPQLFSAMLGNTNAVVSADATAALVTSAAIGGLLLLNHSGDPAMPGLGQTNLNAGGNAIVNVPGGILLGSNCNGTNCGGAYAGKLQGASNSVTAPFTYVNDTGAVSLSNGSTWNATPQSGFKDKFFQDPESGKGQPPMNSTQVTKPFIPVPGSANKGGTLTTTICGGACPSGNYYSTDANGNATGLPIQIGDGVQFNGGNFGEFMFFGGIAMGGAHVDFGPGRYVLAGALPGQLLINSDNNTIVTGGNATDTGRIFVLTDAYYHGDATMAAVVAGIPNKLWSAPGAGGSSPPMQFAEADFKSGNNANSSITLYGLNAASSYVPGDLSHFTSILIWQDQNNSYVKYDSEGKVMVDTACGGNGTDAACPNTPPSTDSPKLQMWAGSNTTYGGVVYQPRGSWMVIHAAANGQGKIMMVSGALDLQGGPNLFIDSVGVPITSLSAALVH